MIKLLPLQREGLDFFLKNLSGPQCMLKMPVGAGKINIICQLSRELIQRGYRVRIVTVSHVITKQFKKMAPELDVQKREQPLSQCESDVDYTIQDERWDTPGIRVFSSNVSI